MAATPMHLLDANALIALSWPKHEHHAAVYRWFSRHAGNGWGSCVLTQAAFVRITSQSAFGGQARDITEVSEVLRRLVAHTAHRLLPLDFPFDEALRLCTGGVVGHRQITDAYLLTAAVRAGMKLLTFDSGLSTLLASDAERSAHIELLR
jgi:uncharacterized protein